MTTENSVPAPAEEKSVDLPNRKEDAKASQVKESIPKKKTFAIRNSSGDVIELDFGRDKSVRLDPYGTADLLLEFREHPALKAREGVIKIIS